MKTNTKILIGLATITGAALFYHLFAKKKKPVFISDESTLPDMRKPVKVELPDGSYVDASMMGYYVTVITDSGKQYHYKTDWGIRNLYPAKVAVTVTKGMAHTEVIPPPTN